MRLGVMMLAGILGMSGATVATAQDALSHEETSAMYSHDPRNPGLPWPATDALGRSMPVEGEAPAPRPDRFVGIFYFLWNGVHDSAENGPFNVAEILQKDPDALTNADSPYWGPMGHMHFWGEPLFGYYLVTDPWVLRRHAHLLADAGIDTLIFDTTNTHTYKEQYMKLCEVFTQVRAEGGRTPQIAFMVNSEAGATADELYNDLYKPGLYPDLWFRWEGKPLLICDPAAASPEVKAFFTLRKAHWPFDQVNTPYAWHWEAAWPQVYGYTDDPEVPEQVNVSVAQNLRRADGKVTNMSSGDARGRSFDRVDAPPQPGAVAQGPNFRDQWERGLELDPPFVMVTGWNEWIASRFQRPDEPVVFVDQYDQENSRDIEMVKGLHGDNYYYQLVQGIRRYKGVPPLPKASGPVTIDIMGDVAQWDAVQPVFADHAYETLHRDFPGVPKLHYTDTSGRNDIVACQVARDAKTVYFHVETREPLTPPSGAGWMFLFLNTDGQADTGWEGYDYIVNLDTVGDNATRVSRNTGGWTWESVAEVPMRFESNRLQIAIPRAVLGLEECAPLSRDFKWADNLQKPGDVMDFYVSGDTAPIGRFNYRYQTQD